MSSMHARVCQLSVCFALLAGCTPTSARSSGTRSDAMSTEQLRVTHGQLRFVDGDRAEIATPAVRAQLTEGPSERVTLRFTYLGPSDHPEPLASGEVRQQLGLKLRARDSCNVVYAMWRFTDPSTLAVSVKSNLGASQHAECGDRGYVPVVPSTVARLPEVRVGEPHTLVAVLADDRVLQLYVDEKVVWSGGLPEVAFAFDGPAGLRSDNVKARIAFRASKAQPAARRRIPAAR